jgi:uncharacterized membrane protein
VLPFGSYFIRWSIAVFPAWVFVIRVYILIDNIGGNPLVGAAMP